MKILYIDDERINLSNFELSFAEEYEVATFLHRDDALEWIQSNQDVAIIIADQRQGPGTGLQLFKKIALIVPDAVRILVNADVLSPEIENAVIKGEIYRCIQKPWNFFAFTTSIMRARDSYLLARKNDALRAKLSQTKQKLLSAQESFERRLREREAEFAAAKQRLHKEIASFKRQVKEQGAGFLAREQPPLHAEAGNEVLPICASCKKIRDTRGGWNHVEAYFESTTDVHFSHGICPECVSLVYPEVHMRKRSSSLASPGKG